MVKLARLEFNVGLLEAILSAKNNDFVQTNCPEDVRVVKVMQDMDDQANNRIILVLSSEEADWSEGKLGLRNPHEIPLIEPFEYTVTDPDEDQPPPETTEET